MRSLFFGAQERRCLVSDLEKGPGRLIRRFDISNGLVCLEASLEGEENPGFCKAVSGIDRMLAFLFVFKGRLDLQERREARSLSLKAAESAIVLSSRQDLLVQSPAKHPMHAFALFVGDFFIRRYLTQNRREPIDRLYTRLAAGVPFELIHRRPVDALSEYLIRHIRASSRKSTLSNIATEHRALELLIHQLGMIEWEDPAELSEEERLITDRAKAVLLQRYTEALTIPELARLVRSNDFKLKRAFKKRFGTTIHSYVQSLRLKEANRLLRDRMMSVSEVARAVGYRHPGHFSALFFERFGIYPGDLLKNPFRDGEKSRL